MGNEASKRNGAASGSASGGSNARKPSRSGTSNTATTTTTYGSGSGTAGVVRSPANRVAASSATVPTPKASSTVTQTSATPVPIKHNSGSLQPLTGSLAVTGSGNRSLAVSVENSLARSPTRAVSAPALSVLRYVDANSMVYTLPSFTSENSLGTGAAVQSTTPVAVGRGGGVAASLGAEARKGMPASPLSTSRRHLSTADVSSPIAIPTYNIEAATAVDDLSCRSPMLNSYRQFSFSSKRETRLACSPTSPNLVNGPSTFFGAGGGGGGFESPMMLRAVEASSPNAEGDAAIHTKFLEITGHPLGLENYGNTCYCNSVIQLIYHCTPLRLRLLELHEAYQTKKGQAGFEEDTVLFQLCNLIAIMHKSNNRPKEKVARERIAPKPLLQCVRRRHETFNNDMQQDAHEFVMFLLNNIWETEQCIMADPANVKLFLQNEASMKKKGGSTFAFWRSSKDKSLRGNNQKNNSKREASGAGASTGDGAAATPVHGEEQTPLQVILQGQFGSLTACLECESVTAREEVFTDLSLETGQGMSLLRCLDHFGDPEYFWGTNKLRCGRCKRLVRAAKTIHVQRLPQYALLIHLKRFQYDVKKQTFTKKADHVALPSQMDVEEYLTDPEVIAQTLRQEQAAQQHTDEAGTGGSGDPQSHRSSDDSADQRDAPIAEIPLKNSTSDTFKAASEEVRHKLRGVARYKARFELTGFVAHIGEGPNSGHYFTCVRYGPQLWRRFDDETVSIMTERDVQQYFGVPSDASGVVTSTAYILLYERVA